MGLVGSDTSGMTRVPVRRAAAACAALALLASAHPASAAELPGDVSAWAIVPGVGYSESVVPESQGFARTHVLSVSLRARGVSFDQVSARDDRTRTPVSGLVASDRALAGVNADFFDISDTGAAQGVGLDRQRGLLHAPRSGWNTALVARRDGSAVIEQVHLVGSVVRGKRRVVSLGGYDVPHVERGQVNLYDRAWGATPGRAVLDGATHVRQVVVAGGVVRSNRAATGPTRLTDQVLLGRGRGADALRTLKVGQRVRIHRGLDDRQAAAVVGGSEQILRAGRVVTPASTATHPRTMAAVSADHRYLWLVTVDGRAESSGGMTLPQLAAYARSLGAADAINLDGGGSSTMVAPDQNGVVGLRNVPSGSRERAVANAVVLTYARG